MRTKSLPSVLALTLALTLSACGGDEPATGGGANADSTGGGGGDIGGGEVTGDIGGTDTADAGGTEDTTDTATADVDDTADTSTEDVPTDTGVTCPGADGCECKDNGECDSGVCLDTHEGKKCAAKCVDTCPNGYACKDIGDGDPALRIHGQAIGRGRVAQGVGKELADGDGIGPGSHQRVVSVRRRLT